MHWQSKSSIASDPGATLDASSPMASKYGQICNMMLRMAELETQATFDLSNIVTEPVILASVH